MIQNVDRARVLAYRIARQGLHRSSTPPERLGVVDLGVQDTPPGSARLALGIRSDASLDEHALVRAWTIRASPFLHHPADLPGLAAALWPGGERDALGRLSWQRSVARDSGITAEQAIRYTAEAMREVITSPTVKGAASAAVSMAIPKALVGYCRGCKTEHVSESLFRLAALPGGLRLDLDGSPPVLVPVDGWPGIPERQVGTSELIRTYLTYVGPASVGDVASWLSTTRSECGPLWPDGLAEVDIEGRRAWLPESEMDLLLDPPEPPHALLVPTSDPFMQERDKNFLVPDKAQQKVMWPMIGRPGAVLVDGEVAGAWRSKVSGRTKLEVRIIPFTPIPHHTRRALEDQAALLAQLRNLPHSTLTLT